jgi:hypothetical protein
VEFIFHSSNGDKVTTSNEELHLFYEHSAELPQKIQKFLESLKITNDKKDEQGLYREFHKDQEKGELYPAWIDVLNVWSNAHHKNIKTKGKLLFHEESVRIAGHAHLTVDKNSVPTLKSAVESNGQAPEIAPLVLILLQHEAGVGSWSEEDLKQFYPMLAPLEFQKVGFSPD